MEKVSENTSIIEHIYLYFHIYSVLSLIFNLTPLLLLRSSLYLSALAFAPEKASFLLFQQVDKRVRKWLFRYHDSEFFQRVDQEIVEYITAPQHDGRSLVYDLSHPFHRLIW